MKYSISYRIKILQSFLVVFVRNIHYYARVNYSGNYNLKRQGVSKMRNQYDKITFISVPIFLVPSVHLT